MRALVGQRIALSVAMVVIVVGGLGISFDASWRLTLVTLGIIPLIVAPIAVTGAYVAKVAEAAQESLVKAGGIATEAVLHMRTVRAYGIEAAVSRKFDDFLELPERQAIRKGLAGGLALASPRRRFCWARPSSTTSAGFSSARAGSLFPI